MRNITKMIIIICSLCLIFACFANAVYAARDLKGVVSTVDGTTADASITQKVTHAAGSVVAILRIIGVTIATVILLAISIKYMTAAPGERADIKKNAIPFVIGALVLFGATGILTIYENIAKQI